MIYFIHDNPRKIVFSHKSRSWWKGLPCLLCQKECRLNRSRSPKTAWWSRSLRRLPHRVVHCVLSHHRRSIATIDGRCAMLPVQASGSNSCSPCASSPVGIPTANGKSLPNGSLTLLSRGPGRLFASANRLPLSVWRPVAKEGRNSLLV